MSSPQRHEGTEISMLDRVTILAGDCRDHMRDKIAAGSVHCVVFSPPYWGPNGTRVVASEAMWKEPIKWNAVAEKAGERHRVFCASLADVFEDWSGDVHDHLGEHYTVGLDDIRFRLFNLIDATPHLDWLLVTKRPDNVLRMWPMTPGIPDKLMNSDASGQSVMSHAERSTPLMYRPNVWLLTSVENQEAADTRIPELLKCRDLSPVLGLSCEPLLGPVDLSHRLGSLLPSEHSQEPANWVHQGIDWVICGGESGHNARPMHPNWARSIRDQCQEAGVPFFFKQWGEWAPLSGHHVMVPGGNYSFTAGGEQIFENDNREQYVWSFDDIDDDDCFSAIRVGKTIAGRLLDGREWNEYPTVKAN